MLLNKPLKKVLKGTDKKNSWIVRLKEVYDKFMSTTEKENSSYKVYLRSFKVLRPDLYTYKPLLAKNLVLEDDDGIEYPENVISYSQRKAYKKKLTRQKKSKTLR